MLVRTFAAAVQGVDAQTITLEVNTGGPAGDKLAYFLVGLPDASVTVLQGIAFVLILASEALRGKDWKTIFARLTRPATGASETSPARVAIGDKAA